jgi:polysaccharide pyruvyl transferase WcaK-like protein
MTVDPAKDSLRSRPPTSRERALRSIAFLNPSLSTHNVGDLFIEDSVKRIVQYDPERSIHIDPRKPVTQESIDRMNECDAAVIVGTNLWYREIYKEGQWMLSRKELARIRIPIIPFGVGTTRHRQEDNGFTAESRDILKAIHDSCNSSSVRDLRTLEALTEAGMNNVALTGCPTLFRSLKPEWTLAQNKPGKKIVVTVRKGQKGNVRCLLRLLKTRGWEVLIAGQQDKDVYFSRTIPFIQKATQTLYQYDLQPYLNCTKEYYGAIGWRLHGNMLHLAHGNPAVFFANCSRAESFCQTFQLPCVPAEDHEKLPEPSIAEAVDRLTDAATFAAFPAQYRRYRSETAAFLTANDLPHNLGGASAVGPSTA